MAGEPVFTTAENESPAIDKQRTEVQLLREAWEVFRAHGLTTTSGCDLSTRQILDMAAIASQPSS